MSRDHSLKITHLRYVILFLLSINFEPKLLEKFSDEWLVGHAKCAIPGFICLSSTVRLIRSVFLFFCLTSVIIFKK